MASLHRIILIALLYSVSLVRHHPNALQIISGIHVHTVPLKRNIASSPYCFAASTSIDLDPSVNFLATQVWPSARLAASMLLRYLDTLDCVVCELGCGPGLPSLTAATMGVSRVIATDLDEFSLELVAAAAAEQKLDNLKTSRFDLVAGNQPLPAADFYILSDVFESATVARGAARVVERALKGGAKVWVFAQTDRYQREVFLEELRNQSDDDLKWLAPDDFDRFRNLWLCDVDETKVSYG